MTTEELLHRYGPVPSMRKQMLGYLHSHFPRACSTEEVAEHIGTTSNLDQVAQRFALLEMCGRFGGPSIIICGRRNFLLK